jgi:hypothetical protein
MIRSSVTSCPDSLTWFAANDPIPVVAWHDPLAASVGFDPLDIYVETYWLPILGPSTTWALRRISTWLMSAGTQERDLGTTGAARSEPRPRRQDEPALARSACTRPPDRLPHGRHRRRDPGGPDRYPAAHHPQRRAPPGPPRGAAPSRSSAHRRPELGGNGCASAAAAVRGVTSVSGWGDREAAPPRRSGGGEDGEAPLPPDHPPGQPSDDCRGV